MVPNCVRTHLTMTPNPDYNQPNGSGDDNRDARHDKVEHNSISQMCQSQDLKHESEDVELACNRLNPPMALERTVSEVTIQPPDGGLLAWSMCKNLESLATSLTFIEWPVANKSQVH